MSDELDRVRRALEQAQEFARTYRFEMTDDYRQLIERVEAMPRNQSGAVKSSRWLGSRAEKQAWLRLVQRAPSK